MQPHLQAQAVGVGLGPERLGKKSARNEGVA